MSLMNRKVKIRLLLFVFMGFLKAEASSLLEINSIRLDSETGSTGEQQVSLGIIFRSVAARKEVEGGLVRIEGYLPRSMDDMPQYSRAFARHQTGNYRLTFKTDPGGIAFTRQITPDSTCSPTDSLLAFGITGHLMKGGDVGGLTSSARMYLGSIEVKEVSDWKTLFVRGRR